MDEGFDPRAEFAAFYANPTIASLGSQERWTVSSTRTTEQRRAKFPVDIRCLLHGGFARDGQPVPVGTIRGAFTNDSTCLMTLDEVTDGLPTASNAALYLQVHADQVLVLDVEKNCPPSEAARLLGLAEAALWSEVSMSGRGYHLVMPLPANFWAFPAAVNKRVLRHPQGWWEVLLEHWVTFTRVPVPPGRRGELAAGAEVPETTWEEVWEQVAAPAAEQAAAEVDLEGEKPEILYEATLVQAIAAGGIRKGPEDFDGDRSRFEFSLMHTLYSRLENFFTKVPFPAGTDADVYGPSERAWLVYEAARALLPHRDKHDELRNGLPYLLNQAYSQVALRLGAEEEPQ